MLPPCAGSFYERSKRNGTYQSGNRSAWRHTCRPVEGILSTVTHLTTGQLLGTKDRKRISGRSSNTKGNDNIIIKRQRDRGRRRTMHDHCRAGQGRGGMRRAGRIYIRQVHRTERSSPAISSKSITDTFKTIGKRFAYGGDTGKDQRVYYFNTKELMDNKFGTRESHSVQSRRQ